MSTDASLVRHGMERLLMLHPFHDIVRIDWQIEDGRHTGPWVIFDLGQPSETFAETPAWAVMPFAIWKATGNVYACGADGAVADDPIISIGREMS